MLGALTITAAPPPVRGSAAAARLCGMDARRRKTARRSLSQTAAQAPAASRRGGSGGSGATGALFLARPFVAMPADVDSAVVPEWVPELSPGLRADVYPVAGGGASPPPHAPFAELLLDRSAVTGGYAERKQAYEFGSALAGDPRSTGVPLAAPPGAPPTTSHDAEPRLARMVAKIAAGVSMLRRARPARPQRVPLGAPAAGVGGVGGGSGGARAPPPPPPPSRAPAFPIQKPSAASSLADWLNKLASGGAFTTSELAAAVPLGPTIVRSTGKVLEMMALKEVPAQRAAWYVRIAVLNECVKQVRPDRRPVSPLVLWTRQLCNLLKTELDAIRARRLSSLGTMDRLVFWNYVLDLARWQADENLLDLADWLDRVALSARTELLSSPALSSSGAKIAILAVQRFLPEFCADRVRLQTIRDALMPAAQALLGATHSAQLGASTPRRGQVRQPMPPMASTRSQPAFNNASLRLASYLGTVSAPSEALARLEADAPDKFTAEAVIEKALELVSERMLDMPTKDEKSESPGYTAESSPSKGKSKKVPVWEGPPGIVLPTEATAALEEFPAVGNPVVLCKVLRKAFATRGGDRAAVDHICRWATESSALDVSQVVATAAVAIDVLSDGGASPTSASSSKSEGIQEALSKKPSNQSNETSVSSSRAPLAAVFPLPCFHREIWLFLKDGGDDDDRETVMRDDRVAWLVSRLCRIGVFSLSSFVRDVARLASLAHPSTARLVRYVQLLPEPEHRPSADARRALLRRNGLLPSRAEEKRVSALSRTVLNFIVPGDEMASIKAGVQLKQKEGGNVGVILSVVDSVVNEVSEAQDKRPEQAGTHLRPTVSFLRAVGASALAVDYLLDHLVRLLAIVADKSRAQAFGNSVYVPFIAGVECMAQVAPVLAATNRLAAALGILGRLWTVGSGGAQQRIRPYVERTALVFGKFFCGRAASDHHRWKEFVVSSLPNTTFATGKALFCALLSGHVHALLVGQQEGLQKPQLHNLPALLSSSTSCVEKDMNNYLWHTLGLCQLNGEKKVQLRTLLVGRDSPNKFDRFYIELGCVNQVAEGVIIRVLTVSEKLNAVATPVDAYQTAIGNITSILGSEWMEALGDEMRPVFAIRILALIAVNVLNEYSGAEDALDALVGRPWLQRLTALHGGKSFFDQLHLIVMENLQSDAGISMENIADLLVRTVATLCGKAHEDENAIIADVRHQPLGITQMRLCSLHAVRAARGMEEYFGTEACEALLQMISKDYGATMSKMILECYANPQSKMLTAGNIAVRAVEQMSESLNCFITGVTGENPGDSFEDQQCSSAWFGADEARCAILHAVADAVSEEQSASLVDALRGQLAEVAGQLEEATAKRCMPRHGSPDGARVSAAVAARVRTLLGLCRRRPGGVHWESTACAAARLLRAAVAVLADEAVDDVIGLVAVGVAQVDAGERAGDAPPPPAAPAAADILASPGDDDEPRGPDLLRAELAHLLAGVHVWLEPPHAKRLRKACGEPPAGAHPPPPVAARAANGTPVNTWYLLEGYGRADGQKPAIPVAAFAAQVDPAAPHHPRPPVRLKRTFSTFSCLVR